MKNKVIAILPAYNAARTLVPFLSTLPKGVFDDIILCDDCSNDGTFLLAQKQRGVTVYQTPRNMGYGGNLKYCLSKALAHDADVIVELHPDGEYGCDGIEPALIEVKQGAKLVLGNRFAHGRPHGMVPVKYAVSTLLTSVYNAVLGTRIPDMHQGFRVYTRSLLQSIPWKQFSEDFLFSFQIIVTTQKKFLSIASVPVTARYVGKKRGATWGHAIRYTVGTFRTLFSPYKQRRLSCPVCKNDLYVHVVYSWKKYSIFECKGCEIAFTSPKPKNIGSFYPSRLGRLKNFIFHRAPRRQVTWIQHFIPGGTILDVGSGDGRFARSMPSHYKVINLDPYNTNADIKRFNEVKQQCAAVVFWESLEHVSDPIETIKHAATLLKPGGILCIEYPRFESWDRKFFSTYWLHLDVPRHLFHFSSRGLGRIVERAGFDLCINTAVFAWEYGTRVGLLIAKKSSTI